jgi:hypothetical protein
MKSTLCIWALLVATVASYSYIGEWRMNISPKKPGCCSPSKGSIFKITNDIDYQMRFTLEKGSWIGDGCSSYSITWVDENTFLLPFNDNRSGGYTRYGTRSELFHWTANIQVSERSDSGIQKGDTFAALSYSIDNLEISCAWIVLPEKPNENSTLNDHGSTNSENEEHCAYDLATQGLYNLTTQGIYNLQTQRVVKIESEIYDSSISGLYNLKTQKLVHYDALIYDPKTQGVYDLKLQKTARQSDQLYDTFVQGVYQLKSQKVVDLNSGVYDITTQGLFDLKSQKVVSKNESDADSDNVNTVLMVLAIFGMIGLYQVCHFAYNLIQKIQGSKNYSHLIKDSAPAVHEQNIYELGEKSQE